MRRLTAVVLVLVGFALVALAYRLYDPRPPVIELPAPREPGRLETIWAGLAIVFNSLTFAAGVTV